MIDIRDSFSRKPLALTYRPRSAFGLSTPGLARRRQQPQQGSAENRGLGGGGAGESLRSTPSHHHSHSIFPARNLRTLALLPPRAWLLSSGSALVARAYAHKIVVVHCPSIPTLQPQFPIPLSSPCLDNCGIDVNWDRHPQSSSKRPPCSWGGWRRRRDGLKEE